MSAYDLTLGTGQSAIRFDGVPASSAHGTAGACRTSPIG